MSYSAPNRLLMPARHSIDTLTDSWMLAEANAASAVWPTANLAIYVPLRVSSACVVRKLWFGSGSTGTGNVDMALYDTAGVALVAATNAAHATSNTEQVFDVTDTFIGPGLYYLGLSSDSGTDTFFRFVATAPVAAAYGVLTESSAYPLPSTATWVEDNTLALVPLAGLLLESTVT